MKDLLGRGENPESASYHSGQKQQTVQVDKSKVSKGLKYEQGNSGHIICQAIKNIKNMTSFLYKGMSVQMANTLIRNLRTEREKREGIFGGCILKTFSKAASKSCLWSQMAIGLSSGTK